MALEQYAVKLMELRKGMEESVADLLPDTRDEPARRTPLTRQP